MILTAGALTYEQRADLLRSMRGNLCRCTGYCAIADAIHGVIPHETGPPAPAT